MFYELRQMFIIIVVIIFILLSGCDHSNPTNTGQEDPDPANPDTSTTTSPPDTVYYNDIYGEWAGGLPYKDPDEDLYESDSLYFTHFAIYKKKAAVGDSIGSIRWDNRTEYCKGTLLAHKASGDTIAVKNSDVGPQEGERCLSKGGAVLNMQYNQQGDREYIKVLPIKATAAGILYPKE